MLQGIGNVGSSISAVMPGFGFARAASKSAAQGAAIKLPSPSPSPSKVPEETTNGATATSKPGAKVLERFAEEAPEPSSVSGVPEPIKARKRDAIKNFFGVKRKAA